MYRVIVERPFQVGAVNVTVAWALPPVAATPVGAPGTVACGPPMNLPKPFGKTPTDIVAVTVLVPVSITETLPLCRLAT